MKNEKKLTKVQRRIEVLKDVLLQLENEKYKAEQGIYVKLPNSLSKLTRGIKTKHQQAQLCLLEEKDACEVCAKGAIFLSIVRKENKVLLSELHSGIVMTETNEELFGDGNMDYVERAFEGWKYDWNDEIDQFHSKYPYHKDRLIAIVKNMIKNKGILRLK